MYTLSVSVPVWPDYLNVTKGENGRQSNMALALWLA